jgi:hypothetical protein
MKEPIKNRLERLCRALKDERSMIEYSKDIPRLSFKIMRIWILEKIHFCMLMTDGDINYIEIEELNIDEAIEIIEDLEKMLVE